MTEGTCPAPAAALSSWLSAPADPQRLAGLIASSRIAAIQASTVDRLPAACFTALQQSEGVRFGGLRPQLRRALLVLGLGSKLGLEPTSEERRELEQMPFVVHAVDQEIVIEVSAVLDRSTGFGQPCFHQWVSGVDAVAVVIDCSRLNQINSVMIAWMLQVVQSAKPVPVKVFRAKSQVATQLRQLRLDHLMQIV